MKGLMRHLTFKDILKDNWKDVEWRNPLVSLTKKLKRLKDPLKKLYKEKFANIMKWMEIARLKLKEVQTRLVKEPINP